jgi:hypothetical protein
MNLLPRRIRIAHLALLVLSAAALPAHGQDMERLLDEAIQREIARLAPDSLKLPEPAGEVIPPPLIQQAGKDFVKAWQTWERVLASASVIDPKSSPPVPKHLINAATDREPFHALLTRCIEAQPPPELSEFNRFTYSDGSFCADGFMSFARRSEKGITLVRLRSGDFSEALKKLSFNQEPPAPFLRAFGVSQEEFRLGAWLHRHDDLDEICKAGGELTARLLMDWADLRGEVELERKRAVIATRTRPYFDEPYFPRSELAQLLRPDNGVTEQTKTRIAAYIEGRGQQIDPPEQWIASCPKGAEKWLVSLARKELEAKLNRSRKRASRLLTAAGIEHPEPVMRPDPRFRVSINGKPWPGELANQWGDGPDLGMSIDFQSGVGRAFRPNLQKPDFLSYEADSFTDRGPIKEMFVYKFPSSSGEQGIHPSHPWLKGDVSLPLDFEKVNEIDIRTVEITIRPKFPERPPVSPEDDIYQLGFGMEGVTEGWFVVKGRQPLVLPRVSPGEYTVRIDHAGALMAHKESFTISETNRLIEPELLPVSSLVVPVEWPEVKAPDKLPQELALPFVRSNGDLHSSLRSVIRLKRKDGTLVEVEGGAPAAANGRFPDSVIFPHLQPGEYEVESPDRTIEPDGISPGCVIKKSSVTVTIREDSPVFVVSAPLKVLYTQKD